VKLGAGFELEKPHVKIPWLIGVEDLIRLLPRRPKRVTPAYYTIRTLSLRGLSHILGSISTSKGDSICSSSSGDVLS
jgi:hypothetical protein